MTKISLMHKDPVIEAHGTLPILVRIRDIILTAVMWLMYLYFMRNFFFFIKDLGDWAFHGFGDSSPYESFKIIATLADYAEIIFISGWIFIGWAVYNKLRYGKKKRRQAQAPLQQEQLAESYHLKTQELSAWQEARVIVMHHDKTGRLTKVDVLS